jgi:hypothetical protein
MMLPCIVPSIGYIFVIIPLYFELTGVITYRSIFEIILIREKTDSFCPLTTGIPCMCHPSHIPQKNLSPFKKMIG